MVYEALGVTHIRNALPLESCLEERGPGRRLRLFLKPNHCLSQPGARNFGMSKSRQLGIGPQRRSTAS